MIVVALRQRRVRRDRPAAGQPGRGVVQQPARRQPGGRRRSCPSTSPPTPPRWGATARRVATIAAARARRSSEARLADRTTVIVIETDPHAWTEGGAWWEVGVPEISDRPSIRAGPRGARAGQGRPAAQESDGSAQRSRCSDAVASGGCTPTCWPTGSTARAGRRAGRGADAGSLAGRPPRRAGVRVGRRRVRPSGVDAVAICTSTDTHVELITAAARAGVAIFCEKPISLDLAEVDAALADVEAAGVTAARRFQPPLRPGPPCRARRRRRGRRRRAAHGAHHQPRPGAAAAGLPRTLGGPVRRHDDPRPRHGPIRHRHRGRRGRSPRARCSSTRRSGRLGDVDTAVVVLRHQNGCTTIIDNSRQCVYGYDQRVEAFGSARHGGLRERTRREHRALGRRRGSPPADPGVLPRPLHGELPRPVGGRSSRR